jgi:hypothetical protein
MTQTAPPLPPAAPQQLVEPPSPAPKRRVCTRWVAIGVVIAALAAAGWVFREPVTWAITSHNHTTGDASAATRVCDSDTVTVRSMAFNGVSIDVTAPGPNFVQVDVRNGFGHRRMFQQVTPNGSGASFAMWDFPYKFDQIDIDLRNGGPCTVPRDVLVELNRADGWP